MRRENGVETAVASLHRHLPIDELCCDLLPELAARWAFLPKSKKARKPVIKLSDEALRVLIEAKKLTMSNVEPQVNPSRQFSRRMLTIVPNTDFARRNTTSKTSDGTR